MRTELKRVGAVIEDEQGNLHAVSRVVHPTGEHEALVTAIVHAIYPLVSTIAHNVDQNRKGDTWAQFSTYSQSIRTADKSRLRRISLDRLTELAESIDDLFMAYETLHANDGPADDKNLVAVGVYYFEENDSNSAEFW